MCIAVCSAEQAFSVTTQPVLYHGDPVVIPLAMPYHEDPGTNYRDWHLVVFAGTVSAAVRTGDQAWLYPHPTFHLQLQLSQTETTQHIHNYFCQNDFKSL